MKRRKQLPIIETRNCLRCGSEFGITALQKNKLYCDYCKIIHSKEYEEQPEIKKRKLEYRKEYYRKVVKPNKTPKRRIIKCERCGNDFLAGSGRPPTVCIECLSKSSSAAERVRAYYRRDYSTEEQLRISD